MSLRKWLNVKERKDSLRFEELEGRDITCPLGNQRLSTWLSEFELTLMILQKIHAAIAGILYDSDWEHHNVV